MGLKPKIIPPKIFFILVTLYLLISLTLFWFVLAGGYFIVIFIFPIALFYLISWIIIGLICLTSGRIQYSQNLGYLILFAQTIALLFSFKDSGYGGITCQTKNFIQRFFDNSTCGELWVGVEGYIFILISYALLVALFILYLLSWRSLQSRQF